MNNKIKTILASLVAGFLIMVIAAYLWQAGSRSRPNEPYSGSLEKITVGIDYSGYNALAWIAQDRRFDREQGLELDIKTCPSGIDAFTDLKADRVDLACGTEFVLVDEILSGTADLVCLSVLASGDNNEVIARRDRGISRPGNLRGKTIAVPRRTSAEFCLGRFLTMNHIALTEVNIVYIKPLDLADALAAGQVDAVQVWEPIAYEVIKRIAPNAITWPAQGGQDLYWLLVGRKEVIEKKSAGIEKLLLALGQAADFMKQQPDTAKAIIARRLKVPEARLQSGKFSKRYGLFLDQGLILAMEDEARWMITNKLTDQIRMPYFLDFFDVAPLAKVDPKAVQIIIPKAGSTGVSGPAGAGKGR